MNIQTPIERDRQISAEPTAEETRRWRRQSLWRSLVLWRAATALALIVAVAAVAALILRPPPVPPTVSFAASLGPPDLMEPYIVTVDVKRGILNAPGQPAPDPSRAAQLWLTLDGEAPQAIGLLNPSRPMQLELPRNLAHRLTEGVGVTVTLEPLGGSTTGAPTGPVVARGTLTPLS